VGTVGWDGAALERSGKMERATARAASVSAGEGRVELGWRVSAMGGGVGWAGQSGRASPAPTGVVGAG